ncbi:MAG: hypothetical protein ACPGEG_06080 [Salibacteraceae bacterium]
MKTLATWYFNFESWFNINFGWFFTNGNKINQYQNMDSKDN